MPQDDTQLFATKRDLSGGSNTRSHGRDIQPNQVITLYNADIGVAGQTTKRKGLEQITDFGASAGTGLFGYMPDGGNNKLIATLGKILASYDGSATASAYSSFTSSLPTSMLKIGESGEGEVFVVGNGTDNWFRFEPDDLTAPQDLGATTGTGSDSPPKSTVACYFRNRWWILKDLATITKGNLFFSAAYSADYSTAFDDVTDAFRIPCGTERALLPLRDTGIMIIGSDQIWGLNPSLIPDPTTDKPEKILDIGSVAGNTCIQAADDVMFLATDGVRGVFRTQQDKLQGGNSFPLSYALKTEFDTISWGSISKACAIYWDNKYFLSLPTSSSTYNNQVWVYYPATQAWMVITGWNVAAWAKCSFSGEERLYAIDSTDGLVYRAWYTQDDVSTAIDYTEIGRKEDMGQPLVKKFGDILGIKASVSGNYDISVYVAADDNDWSYLGVLNLAGDAPVLPVTLPFTLANPSIVYKKFHLDNLGEWDFIQYKLQHNATNTGDEITIYERTLTAYPLQFEGE